MALAENRSFAHAANTGAAAITDDLVFLLNPDTEVEEGAVATLVEALEQRPRTAGVVPLLVNPDGSTQHRWQLRRLPTVARLATGRSGAPAFSSPPTARQLPWRNRRRRRGWSGATCGGPSADSTSPSPRRGGRMWISVPGWPAAWARSDFPADEGFVVVPRARVRHQGGSSLAGTRPSRISHRLH